ncbi:cytosine permease [Dermacoccaceae bacterium W4C1]
MSFKAGGYITAALGFVGALWSAVIGEGDFAKFVGTLGAVLAPLYGVLVADYYILRRQSSRWPRSGFRRCRTSPASPGSSEHCSVEPCTWR